MLRTVSYNPPGLLLRAAVAAGIAAFSVTAAAESDGWYTEEQAAEGKPTYNTYCAQCHRPDLTGAQGPPLKGEAFISKWETGAELYKYTNETMPPLSPGAVPEPDLVNIMAFIFSENGLPGGEKLTREKLDRPLEP